MSTLCIGRHDTIVPFLIEHLQIILMIGVPTASRSSLRIGRGNFENMSRIFLVASHISRRKRRNMRAQSLSEKVKAPMTRRPPLRGSNKNV